MTLPVHYQPGKFKPGEAKGPGHWPICGERLFSYDSTAVYALVTCQACLARITPDFTRASGDTVCATCGKILWKHGHQKFGALELFKRCDGSWVKL